MRSSFPSRPPPRSCAEADSRKDTTTDIHRLALSFRAQQPRRRSHVLNGSSTFTSIAEEALSCVIDGANLDKHVCHSVKKWVYVCMFVGEEGG